MNPILAMIRTVILKRMTTMKSRAKSLVIKNLDLALVRSNTNPEKNIIQFIKHIEPFLGSGSGSYSDSATPTESSESESPSPEPVKSKKKKVIFFVLISNFFLERNSKMKFSIFIEEERQVESLTNYPEYRQNRLSADEI